MQIFEWILALLAAAVALSALARRWHLPYPALLAALGAGIAFLPGAPTFALEPQLALALFVAPVLLDAAYDASTRDLRENWVPITTLVFVAVGITTVAVACVVKALVPDLPWAAAVALGAIVAPPDAAAAVAVLHETRPPHRILQILEGESLFNDATALLIYRFAVAAATGEGWSASHAAPVLLGTVVGSVVLGVIGAWLVPKVVDRIDDVPTSTVVQFVATFGMWIAAERLHLSGILAVVTFAIVLSRNAPGRMPARIRVPSYAVWSTVVFVLNVLAFVLIGLQVGPILSKLRREEWVAYAEVAFAVLGVVIATRMAWVMLYNAAVRWHIERFGDEQTRAARDRPTPQGGFLIGWCGMRGIVTLAAALALPDGEHPFPGRNLILVTAFTVVLGTLLIQGMTLRPLLRRFDLKDDAPVERETTFARQRVLEAVIAKLDGDPSPAAETLRFEFRELWPDASNRRADDPATPLPKLRRDAVQAGRDALNGLMTNDEIGDNAFQQVEAELDRTELYAEAGDSIDAEGPGTHAERR